MADTPPPPAVEDQADLAARIVDEFKKGLKGSGETIPGGLLKMAYTQASELFTMHEGMINVFSENSDTFQNMYAGVAEMQHGFYGMASDSGIALSAIFKNQGELIGEYQGIIGTNLLQIHATRERVTAKDMADLTLYQRALDFTKDQTQKFMERQFALTGEANDELLKQALAYSNAIEKSTGISSKIIAENISGMMSDVRTFGNMTVEEMSEAAAAIAEVGLSVDSLGGLVKKFSTFEGAADSVSKLTQVFGVQMDTMKYMTASFESPQDMLAMIQEDFERAGVDMADMDMAQKRLLADTTGMSISDIEKLLGEAGSDLSSFAAQVGGATAGVGESEISGALAAAEGDIAVLNQMYGSVEEASREAGKRTARAISGVFSDEIRAVGRESELMVAEGIRFTNQASRSIGNDVRSYIGVDSITTPMNDFRAAMNRRADTTGQVADGGGDIVDFFGALTTGESGAMLVELANQDQTPPTQGTTSRQVQTEILSTEQEANVSAMLVNGADSEPIQVINLEPGMSHQQIVAFTAEINSATNNNMNEEQRREMIELLTLAVSNRPNDEIVVRLEDTTNGLLAWLSDQGVVTVDRNV